MGQKITEWIGSPYSVVLHTVFFITIFLLPFLGVEFDKVLLILTTVVSLEAIYLAIFIQMSVNRNTQSLEAVEEDIEELEEDIDEIQADQDEDEKRDIQDQKDLDNIELKLQQVLSELESIKKSRYNQR